MQLSLWLLEDTATPAALAALTPDERLRVVAVLARVMAKSINEKEEDDE